LIYVGPPDLEARVEIFKICLASKYLRYVETPLDGNLEEICKKMANCT
jgi:SpoVK/Ycf46/Vps4 family AAA+-type ATPase